MSRTASAPSGIGSRPRLVVIVHIIAYYITLYYIVLLILCYVLYYLYSLVWDPRGLPRR